MTKIATESNSPLASAVKDLLLANTPEDGSLRETIEELREGGCMSGSITGLIYYTETTQFYDTHRGEIEALLVENSAVADYMAYALKDYKNGVVWKAFEIMADQIYMQGNAG